jgi:hypothetical protein
MAAPPSYTCKTRDGTLLLCTSICTRRPHLSAPLEPEIMPAIHSLTNYNPLPCKPYMHILPFLSRLPPTLLSHRRPRYVPHLRRLLLRKFQPDAVASSWFGSLNCDTGACVIHPLPAHERALRISPHRWPRRQQFCDQLQLQPKPWADRALDRQNGVGQHRGSIRGQYLPAAFAAGGEGGYADCDCEHEHGRDDVRPHITRGQIRSAPSPLPSPSLEADGMAKHRLCDET